MKDEEPSRELAGQNTELAQRRQIAKKFVQKGPCTTVDVANPASHSIQYTLCYHNSKGFRIQGRAEFLSSTTIWYIHGSLRGYQMMALGALGSMHAT